MCSSVPTGCGSWWVCVPLLSHALVNIKHSQTWYRPARSESLQPHTEWSSRTGSEPPSVEADVHIWHYALLVVHARKEEVLAYSGCPAKEAVRGCLSGHKTNSVRTLKGTWGTDATQRKLPTVLMVSLPADFWWVGSHTFIPAVQRQY